MNIIVRTRKEAGIDFEVLYKLVQESFTLWTAKGFDAPALHRSFEEFMQAISNATVFVGLDAETKELLGMHCFYIDSRNNCLNGFYLAVYPKYMNQGIASRMLALEEKYIRKSGFKYLQGETAINAPWSVNWHLKNGYRIVGYRRCKGRNYASYVFRKQLICDPRHHPTDLLWMPPLAPLTARLRFTATYLATRLLKYSDGHLNPLGRVLKSIISK